MKKTTARNPYPMLRAVGAQPIRAKIRVTPVDEGVIADEQKTIDLYFHSGLIRRRLDTSDIVDRSFSEAIAKGAGL